MRDRDERLGELLLQLEVPDHAPGFFERLQAELEAQPVAPMPRRFPVLLRPSFALGLALVLVVVIVGTWIGVPGDRFGGPTIATAAELEVRIAQAFAGTKTVEGNVDIEQRIYLPGMGPGERDPSIGFEEATDFERAQYRFAATEDGDLLSEIVSHTSRFPQQTPRGEAYFATEGTVREFFGREPESEFRGAPIQRTGAFLGFAGEGSSVFPVKRSLGSVVRVLLAQNPDVPVREVEHQGRPSWRLEVAVNPVGEISPDRQEITVDRETGIPVLVEETRRDLLVRRTSVSRIRVNGPPFNELFEAPAPSEPVRLPFERVSLEKAPELLGYRPFLPSDVPSGYRLKQVSVAKETQAPLTENPIHRDLFQAAYRRGLDSFVVSVMRTGPHKDLWNDPVREFFQGERGLTDVRLDGGAFDGAEAEIQIDAGTPPHIWFVTDEFVVSVAGDLTAAQLLNIAESLQVQD